MTSKGSDLDVPVFFVTGPPPPYRQNEKIVEQKMTKPQKSKKCCFIFGMTTVFVVALVVAAVLLGLHLRQKHRKDSFKEMKIMTPYGEQIIRVNTETGEQEFELTKRQFHVLHNFKQGVSVYKMHYGGRLACFLRPLDKTGRPDPETLAKYIESGRHHEARSREGDMHREVGIYIPVTSETPDLYISFRSRRASELCRGLERYWLYTDSEREADQPKPASYIAALPMNKDDCIKVFCHPPVRRCWMEKVCDPMKCQYVKKCGTVQICEYKCPD